MPPVRASYNEPLAKGREESFGANSRHGIFSQLRSFPGVLRCSLQLPNYAHLRSMSRTDVTEVFSCVPLWERAIKNPKFGTFGKKLIGQF